MKLPSREIKKIAIFRALQLGDLLCSIPAVRALRAAYPDAEITLLGMAWAKSLTERFPHYFNRFIHFPGFPGLPEQPFEARLFTPFLQHIQDQHFDLILQMQGNGSIVNPMIELLGARYTAGFCRENDFCADPELFMLYPEGISEIERHLRLMNHLGIPSQGLDLEFPVTEKDEAELQMLKFPLKDGEYICIHPGSRGAYRQWPPGLFAAIADYCAKHGFRIVITGTKEEAAIVQHVMSIMKSETVNAAGQTSLGAVGALIRHSAMLISNCTGVSHIAAALKTRSIVISMDGEPERWAPLNTSLHRTINWLVNPDMDWVYGQASELMLLALSQRHELRKEKGFTA